MLGGENKSRPLGYTIVEIMVVLAVSSVLFLLAAGFINGRQSNTAFTQGVNDMASNIQDVIQQVQSGKYSDASIDCCFNGSGVSITTPGGGGCGSGTQGANPTCVFLGKLIYFSDDPANRDASYSVFTLAGGRIDTNGNAFTSPNAAYATVVNTPGGATDPLDLTTRQVTPQNLKIEKVTANGLARTYGIGFFQNPALNGGAIASSGTATINLYYVSPRLALGNNNEPQAKAEINNHTSLRSATSADICITDGTRYADILLGTPNSASSSSGNSLVATVKMDGRTPC